MKDKANTTKYVSLKIYLFLHTKKKEENRNNNVQSSQSARKVNAGGSYLYSNCVYLKTLFIVRDELRITADMFVSMTKKTKPSVLHNYRKIVFSFFIKILCGYKRKTSFLNFFFHRK